MTVTFTVELAFNEGIMTKVVVASNYSIGDNYLTFNRDNLLVAAFPHHRVVSIIAKQADADT